MTTKTLFRDSIIFLCLGLVIGYPSIQAEAKTSPASFKTYPCPLVNRHFHCYWEFPVYALLNEFIAFT